MKKKIFKGSMGLFTVSIFFLVITLIPVLLQVFVSDKNFYISRDRIYGKGEQNGSAVANIYSIDGPIATNNDKKSEYYIVETDKGYSLLQMAINDKELEKIKKENPYQMVVNIKKDYHSEISSLLRKHKLDPELFKQVEKREYLQSTSVTSLVESLKYVLLLTIAITVFIFLSGIYKVFRTKSNYNKLFDKYEELGGNLSLLETESDFFDKDMGLALYKNHLIFFNFGFEIVDLTDIKRIVYTLQTVIIDFSSVRRYCFNMVSENGKAKKYYFKKYKKVGEQTDLRVGELIQILQNKFPKIDF